MPDPLRTVEIQRVRYRRKQVSSKGTTSRPYTCDQQDWAGVKYRVYNRFIARFASAFKTERVLDSAKSYFASGNVVENNSTLRANGVLNSVNSFLLLMRLKSLHRFTEVFEVAEEVYPITDWPETVLKFVWWWDLDSHDWLWSSDGYKLRRSVCLPQHQQPAVSVWADQVSQITLPCLVGSGRLPLILHQLIMFLVRIEILSDERDDNNRKLTCWTYRTRWN